MNSARYVPKLKPITRKIRTDLTWENLTEVLMPTHDGIVLDRNAIIGCIECQWFTRNSRLGGLRSSEDLQDESAKLQTRPNLRVPETPVDKLILDRILYVPSSHDAIKWLPLSTQRRIGWLNECQYHTSIISKNNSGLISGWQVNNFDNFNDKFNMSILYIRIYFWWINALNILLGEPNTFCLLITYKVAKVTLLTSSWILMKTFEQQFYNTHPYWIKLFLHWPETIWSNKRQCV